MDLARETDDYIRESIEHSVGLPISSNTLQIKLLASEDDRHRLQEQIFLLQDRLRESQKRVDQYRAEASMNTQGLRKLVKENEELRARVEDEPTIVALAAEVESLQKDKEHLRTNLLRAEEEVKVLFEENRLLDEENKRLVRQLHRERKRQGSESKPSSCKPSAGVSATVSNLTELYFEHGRLIDFSCADSPRRPLSPLHQNSLISGNFLVLSVQARDSPR